MALHDSARRAAARAPLAAARDVRRWLTALLLLAGCAHVLGPIVLRKVAAPRPGAVEPARAPCVAEHDETLGPVRPNDDVERYGSERNLSRGSCSDRPGALCLWLQVQRCVDTHEAALAKAEPFLRDGMPVRLSWGGASGPRCASRDVACGPAPYDGSRTKWHGAPERGVIREPHESASRCNHDGECTGGNFGCLRWDELPDVDLAYYDTGLSEALCGCVEHQCTWFTE